MLTVDAGSQGPLTICYFFLVGPQLLLVQLDLDYRLKYLSSHGGVLAHAVLDFHFVELNGYVHTSWVASERDYDISECASAAEGVF